MTQASVFPSSFFSRLFCRFSSFTHKRGPVYPPTKSLIVYQFALLPFSFSHPRDNNCCSFNFTPTCSRFVCSSTKPFLSFSLFPGVCDNSANLGRLKPLRLTIPTTTVLLSVLIPSTAVAQLRPIPTNTWSFCKSEISLHGIIPCDFWRLYRRKRIFFIGV
ncbi:unnamed protein product [Acanthosepion pharaonis]|uniref:Uncharacterized protein n=1 Tax=Acanthosepion pharaonis TaxID=158019 RepID=A0A812CTQ3_ACAPH|nr:unnamed protein product [Sepia pharaonis]